MRSQPFVNQSFIRARERRLVQFQCLTNQDLTLLESETRKFSYDFIETHVM